MKNNVYFDNRYRINSPASVKISHSHPFSLRFLCHEKIVPFLYFLFKSFNERFYAQGIVFKLKFDIYVYTTWKIHLLKASTVFELGYDIDQTFVCTHFKLFEVRYLIFVSCTSIVKRLRLQLKRIGPATCAPVREAILRFLQLPCQAYGARKLSNGYDFFVCHFFSPIFKIIGCPQENRRVAWQCNRACVATSVSAKAVLANTVRDSTDFLIFR